MLMSSQEQGYNHILKYMSIFGGVQGLNILISLVKNKIVALLLGAEGMGLVSLFQTTVNFISQSTWAFRSAQYVMYQNSLMQAMRLASHTSLRWFVRGRC